MPRRPRRASAAAVRNDRPLSPASLAARLPALRLSSGQRKRLAAYGQVELLQWLLPRDAAQAASLFLAIATMACLAAAGITGQWMSLFEVVGTEVAGNERSLVTRVGSWGYGDSDSWTFSPPWNKLPDAIAGRQLSPAVRYLRCWPAFVNFTCVIVLTYTALHYSRRRARHRPAAADRVRCRAAAMSILCSLVTLLESAIALGLQSRGDIAVGMGLAIGPISALLAVAWLGMQYFQVRNARRQQQCRVEAITIEWKGVQKAREANGFRSQHHSVEKGGTSNWNEKHLDA